MYRSLLEKLEQRIRSSCGDEKQRLEFAAELSARLSSPQAMKTPQFSIELHRCLLQAAQAFGIECVVMRDVIEKEIKLPAVSTPCVVTITEEGCELVRVSLSDVGHSVTHEKLDDGRLKVHEKPEDEQTQGYREARAKADPDNFQSAVFTIKRIHYAFFQEGVLEPESQYFTFPVATVAGLAAMRKAFEQAGALEKWSPTESPFFIIRLPLLEKKSDEVSYLLQLATSFVVQLANTQLKRMHRTARNAGLYWSLETDKLVCLHCVVEPGLGKRIRKSEEGKKRLVEEYCETRKQLAKKFAEAERRFKEAQEAVEASTTVQK